MSYFQTTRLVVDGVGNDLHMVVGCAVDLCNEYLELAALLASRTRSAVMLSGIDVPSLVMNMVLSHSMRAAQVLVVAALEPLGASWRQPEVVGLGLTVQQEVVKKQPI